MATMTASVFASVLIFVVPFGCSAFLSKPEVGYEYEFVEIKLVDSKIFLFLEGEFKSKVQRASE
jgi:hypothetical protein